MEESSDVKVLVCGSRTWNDYDAIRARLAQLPPDVRIIEGVSVHE